MLIRPNIGLNIEQDELKGFARTTAEIEWLLLVLALIYLVAGGASEEGKAAISMALFFFAAFILGLHYVRFYRQETRLKIALESWVMVLFITSVVWYAGGIRSPLLNLYLLPVIASALIPREGHDVRRDGGDRVLLHGVALRSEDAQPGLRSLLE